MTLFEILLLVLLALLVLAMFLATMQLSDIHRRLNGMSFGVGRISDKLDRMSVYLNEGVALMMRDPQPGDEKPADEENFALAPEYIDELEEERELFYTMAMRLVTQKYPDRQHARVIWWGKFSQADSLGKITMIKELTA